MKIDERKSPILRSIENNKLTDKVFDILFNSGFDENAIADIKLSFDFFIGKTLQINYISSTIHEKLSDTKNFIKGKSLLSNSPETTGLLLLPKTVLPDFSNVPDYVNADPNDYPINAILYSWLSTNTHDKISNKSHLEDLKKRIEAGEKPPLGADWDSYMESLTEEEDLWDEEKRTLLIIPIYNEKITQATKQLYSISDDEMYGRDYNEEDEEDWYGKIHDYVMSFILFYNYAEEIETHA